MARLRLLVALALAMLALVDSGDCERLVPEGLEQFLVHPFEMLLQDVLPRLIGQQPNNVNGTDSQYESYALSDDSNEDVGTFTPQELIERAGFSYKNHYALSGDGYITQLIHLINPLADQSKLKQPPVVLMHGGQVDSSVYLRSSNIQHHPEPWPRLPQDGPMSSWNRSLAFVLANNGYDVWLPGTRGSNRQNMGHTKLRVFEPQGSDRTHFDKPLDTKLAELADTYKYWDFSFNEIIEFDLAAQLERVIELTGAEKLSYLSYSYSTISSLPFFGSRPEYAKLIHQHIVMTPLVTNRGSNSFTRLMQELVSRLDLKLGITMSNLLMLTQPVRDLVILINRDKVLRYTLIKGMTTLTYGASAKYHANLDSSTVGHYMEQTGFGLTKHYSQQMIAGRLQKFDYGAVQNLIKYGSPFPPVWDIADQHIDNWLLIEAENDNLATQASVQQVYDTIRQKPRRRIVLASANHVDLTDAFDNDIQVNLPILAYLDEYQLPARPLPEHSAIKRARLDRVDRELAKFVPGVHAGDSNGVPEAS